VVAALLTLIMIGLIVVREYSGSSLRTRPEPDVVMPVPATSGDQQPADSAVVTEPDGSDSASEETGGEMENDTGYSSATGDPGASRAYAVVDQMPVFNGNLNTYLSANIRYPEYARQNEEEGRAVVRFVIDTDGSVTDVEVLRSSGSPLLDTEAVRVVSEMPPWTPGRDAGETVRVYFTLPVTFKLD
jgi:TonB family protein